MKLQILRLHLDWPHTNRRYEATRYVKLPIRIGANTTICIHHVLLHFDDAASGLSQKLSPSVDMIWFLQTDVTGPRWWGFKVMREPDNSCYTRYATEEEEDGCGLP